MERTRRVRKPLRHKNRGNPDRKRRVRVEREFAFAFGDDGRRNSHRPQKRIFRVGGIIRQQQVISRAFQLSGHGSAFGGQRKPVIALRDAPFILQHQNIGEGELSVVPWGRRLGEGESGYFLAGFGDEVGWLNRAQDRREFGGKSCGGGIAVGAPDGGVDAGGYGGLSEGEEGYLYVVVVDGCEGEFICVGRGEGEGVSGGDGDGVGGAGESFGGVDEGGLGVGRQDVVGDDFSFAFCAAGAGEVGGMGGRTGGGAEEGVEGGAVEFAVALDDMVEESFAGQGAGGFNQAEGAGLVESGADIGAALCGAVFCAELLAEVGVVLFHIAGGDLRRREAAAGGAERRLALREYQDRERRAGEQKNRRHSRRCSTAARRFGGRSGFSSRHGCS